MILKPNHRDNLAMSEHLGDSYWSLQQDDLSLLVKEQDHELQKLKSQIANNHFDAVLKSYQNKNSPIKERVVGEQKGLILKLQNELAEFKQFSYHKDLEYAQQLEAMEELLQAKDLRLKALEQEPPSQFSDRDKLMTELKMAHYKLERQTQHIKKLEAQSQGKPTPVGVDQSTQTEKETNKDIQAVKRMLKHLNEATCPCYNHCIWLRLNKLNNSSYKRIKKDLNF